MKYSLKRKICQTLSPYLQRFKRSFLYPVNIVTKPFLFVIAKVKATVQFIFGYLVRLGVFSFGEWNHSWVKRKLIEIYKGGCYDTHNRLRFDPLRLQQAFATLERVGGIRAPTYSKDGTKLDTMITRYKDVKKKIEENGGKIIDAMPLADVDMRAGRNAPTLCREVHSMPEMHADVLIPADAGSEKWNTFHQEVLLSLGLEKSCITLKNGKTVEGFILKRWYSKNPKRPKEGQCYIRCNAPTESYAMAKRDIMRHILALRGDMLCFDYRGTWESEGVPTEGGYNSTAKQWLKKPSKNTDMHGKTFGSKAFVWEGQLPPTLRKNTTHKGLISFFKTPLIKWSTHSIHKSSPRAISPTTD